MGTGVVEPTVGCDAAAAPKVILSLALMMSSVARLAKARAESG